MPELSWIYIVFLLDVMFFSCVFYNFYSAYRSFKFYPKL